jgi:uncharacterized protein (TIGR00255 family)
LANAKRANDAGRSARAVSPHLKETSPMALQSMTGFARTDGFDHAHRWTWEMRSVNSKGLDVRLRLPPGFERLEMPVKERAAKHLIRGSCTFNLTLQRETPVTTFKINEQVLDAVIAAMNLVSLKIDATAPTLDGILQIRGVIEQAESVDAPEVRASLDAALLAGADAALDALAAARADEGAAIKAVLEGHIARIEALTEAAERNPARRPEAIRARLSAQIAELIGAAPTLDPQRLHQEAVLLATKADIREEIDRLRAHIGQARQVLAAGGAVGRRLDFLAQEFNRESNTLCSKSNDTALTAIGLDLKAAVDQLREQIQNIE